MSYQVSRNGKVTAGPFPLGMDNRQPRYSLPEGSIRNAVNIDLDNHGRPRRRKGSTKVYSGIETKGGYSCQEGTYFVEGTTLCKFNDDNTSTVVSTGILGSTYAYEYFNGTLYFSDGLLTKKVIGGVAYPWGLSVPSAPIMSTTTGLCKPGVYIAAYVWVDENGTESGASSPWAITVESTSGIVFNSLPGLIDGAVSLRIYLSTPNGKVLYRVTDTTAPSYTLSITSYTSSLTLSNFHKGPPPAGSIIKVYKGRMYICVGNVVWYSEPYSFDLFKTSESFIQFTDELTIMEPVNDGIYFASLVETAFYAGTPEDGFVITELFEYGGIFGTSRKIPNTDEVTWMSQRGQVVGSSSGQCTNKQESMVATESGTTGASIIKEYDGLRQFVSCIDDPTTSTLAATDFIDAEIIRRA